MGNQSLELLIRLKMHNKYKKIVFVAEYPSINNIKEGMSQRMEAIDNQFIDDARIYLFVSHRFFWKMEQFQCKENVLQYKCNLFLHFFFILRMLIASRFVYFHSVQNVLPILPALLFLSRRKQIILDIHGVVPEEHKLNGHWFKSVLYNLSEKFIFTRLFLAISVTNAMSRHYKIKYPNASAKMVIYPILPLNISELSLDTAFESGKEIIVIYSGNMQKWQNVDLMADLISKNISPRIRYQILTGMPDQMKDLFERKNLGTHNNVYIDSVAPSELGAYYAKASYGIVLRDDIVVNRVACPTKLIEYMHYGLIPVVLSVQVGDFYNLGYEYLEVRNFTASSLQLCKSHKNINIIADIKSKHDSFDIKAYLNSIM